MPSTNDPNRSLHLPIINIFFLRIMIVHQVSLVHHHQFLMSLFSAVSLMLHGRSHTSEEGDFRIVRLFSDCYNHHHSHYRQHLPVQCYLLFPDYCCFL